MRISTFRKRPLRIPKLLRPRTDIVAACIPQHILQCLLFRDVPARLPNHDRELRLVIARAVLAEFWNADFLRRGPAEGGARLNEEDRVRRDGHAGFLGVVAIVEPEAADDGDLVGGDWGQELRDGQGFLGDLAVEYGARDEFCFDLLLLDGCDAKVGRGLGVDLAQVDLAIFLGDEAD